MKRIPLAALSLVGTILILGAAVPFAKASTASSGPLTISVPDITLWRNELCEKYPFTLRINVRPRTWWRAAVIIYGPSYSPDDDPRVADDIWGVGPVTVVRDAELCPFQDGGGTIIYSAGLLQSSGMYFAKAYTVGKLPSRVTMGVTPNTVVRGGPVYVTGKVSCRNYYWELVRAKYKTVTIQFQRRGSSRWIDIATKKTSALGTFSLKTNATTDGYYRAVFAGTLDVNTATSQPVFVDVN